MKKRFTRVLGLLLALTMVITTPAMVMAAAADGAAVDSTTANDSSMKDPAANDASAKDAAAGGDQTTPADAPAAAPSDTNNSGTNGNTDTSGTAAGGTSGNTDAGTANSGTDNSGNTNSGSTNGSSTDTNTGKDQTTADGGSTSNGDTAAGGSTSTEKKDVNGKVDVDQGDVSGKVTVETDKNDDNVTIKKHDKPYLALGSDLSPDQQTTVLSLMGINPDQLGNYDVVYVNNSEEHQYLDSYIEKSKIGTKSLSSVVIVERDKGNGINISTNNISYCTVGMYKNALATAGIENADIIVAAPFAISGTAALVGVFKAYKEMTGEEVKEQNVDAALNELVITGNLEKSSGLSSEEVENIMAYVKQQVVEHDLTDETSIRDAINEGCKEFEITLTEDEINQVVALMLKIGNLDLDLDSLLNSAQSIYDRISGGDNSGFFAKFTGFFSSIWDKIKGLFD